MFLLAKLPQRETFYPIRAHQKVIDQNQNQNQTFDDRSIFAEILKTDRRAIAGSLRPRQIKLYSFADRSYRSEQSRFRAVPVPFFPPRLPVPRIDGLATGSRKIWSGKKKEKKEGVRVELAGSLLVNHAMTNYRCIDAGKRAEDRSIEAVPVAVCLGSESEVARPVPRSRKLIIRGLYRGFAPSFCPFLSLSPSSFPPSTPLRY